MVLPHPVDSVHICASGYPRIVANRWCYQARDKQYASLTLSIGCANTLYDHRETIHTHTRTYRGMNTLQGQYRSRLEKVSISLIDKVEYRRHVVG
jgi:hypothetical protein